MKWRPLLRPSKYSSVSALVRVPRPPNARHARFDSSSSTQAHRPSRDVASLLDSPLNRDPSPRQVQVLAHVRSVRAQKQRAFVNVGDGSTSRPVQVLMSPALASGLGTGTSVEISGSWRPSPPSKEQTHELHADKIKVLGHADPQTYPVQKKHLTPEFLRTIPHLRVRTVSNALLVRLRSECEHLVSTFFRDGGFVRLHPPAITSSDCEGAGEVFTVRPRDREAPTPPEAEKELSGAPKGEEEFFRSPKYLTVSNQLHLEAFVHEHQRVWALAPTFRAEKSDTPRHLSEFYMLETELRCHSLSEVMDIVEQMIRSVAHNIQESPLGAEILSRAGKHVDDDGKAVEDNSSLLLDRFKALRQSYWPRITYTQAIQLLRSAAQENPELFSFNPDWQTGLQLEHEKYIASTVGGGCPVFVTDYPKHQKPFYMLPTEVQAAKPPTPSLEAEPASHPRWTSHSLPPKPSLGEHLQQAHPTVACFDLLLPDVGELVGGSLREHRLRELEAGMQEKGLSGDGLDWYMDLRRYGSVPHGGFGLGFDRLLMYLSGAESVRDVVQWPRYYGKCVA